MSGCTPTDKPLIAILLAVYEPRMDWLREQLLSLNAQDYPNLQLVIRDDHSPTVPLEAIRACAEECVTAFPWELRQNERNLGSNGTFERLTQEAGGAYFAYCDQDDVWLPEKLSTLEAAMDDENVLLVCSDMLIIDENGRQTADSITKVRRHHVFRSGPDLTEGLLFSNFVAGCSMLVRAGQAKAAVPFCPYLVHDQYLALWCAERGELLSLPQKLLRYRLHGGNQTGLMAGVHDKKSYGAVRIDLALNRLLWLREHFPCRPRVQKTMDEGILWLRARQDNWNHRGGATVVWKYRRFAPISSAAELVLKNVPDPLFMAAIGLARENRL